MKTSNRKNPEALAARLPSRADPFNAALAGLVGKAAWTKV